VTWVFGEAWRDVVSGTAHALRYGLVLALLVAGGLALDALTVDAIVGRAVAYRDSGASIVTLQAPGHIDAAACDALARLPGVSAAGALRAQPDALVAAALPGSSITAFDVSPAALRLFDADDDDDTHGSGVALSAAAASRLGAHSGSRLVTTAGDTTVRGVFAWPDDGRRTDLSFAALVPTTTAEPFDECWVAAWPMSDRLAPILWSTLLPGAADSGQQPMVGAVNTTLGSSYDGAAQYRDRATRHLPWAVLVAGFAIGYVAVRTRRLELASAQHAGVTRLAQLAQVLLETLAWVAAGSVVAAGAASLVVTTTDAEAHAALSRVAAQMIGTAALAALAGAAAACALTRERHLFRYFKAR
jgi:hypothetical protein